MALDKQYRDEFKHKGPDSTNMLILKRSLTITSELAKNEDALIYITQNFNSYSNLMI